MPTLGPGCQNWQLYKNITFFLTKIFQKIQTFDQKIVYFVTKIFLKIGNFDQKIVYFVTQIFQTIEKIFKNTSVKVCRFD